MPNSKVEKFTNALKNCEDARDPSSLLDLFEENCEIANVAIQPLHGREGAQRFWRDYLREFNEVHTEFTRITEAGDRSFLEWRSRGNFPSGRPFTYDGITVLDWEGDRVRKMMAYYDSAVFLKHGGKHGPHDESSESQTHQIMEGLRRDQSTPSEGILTSTDTDRDAATS